MVPILSAVVSLFAFRFRRRASLEFELIALRHQLTVLRPSPRSAACIIAMSVAPLEFARRRAPTCSPPNCSQFIFEQGQRGPRQIQLSDAFRMPAGAP
jgi:hypothetical protein